LRSGLFLLRTLLPNLLLEIAKLSTLVNGRLQLVLPIEFDKNLPDLDMRSARRESGDDQRVIAGSCGTDETGCRDIVKAGGLDQAGQPESSGKRAATYGKPHGASRWRISDASVQPAHKGDRHQEQENQRDGEIP